MTREKFLLPMTLLVCSLLSGCAAFGNPNATDPVERGLSYVAAAIITAAIIQALCNK